MDQLQLEEEGEALVSCLTVARFIHLHTQRARAEDLVQMSQAMSGGTGGGGAGQFGDTTFTKVFVGGLAWETHKEGMRAYFEPFGDILEAVVITDKNTGRSKGYGFVSSKSFPLES